MPTAQGTRRQYQRLLLERHLNGLRLGQREIQSAPSQTSVQNSDM